MMLDKPPNNFTKAFIPDPTQPGKRSFAINIQAAPRYSQALKDIIIEMMYEKPADRPTLKDLKERVDRGLRAANRAQYVAFHPSLFLSFCYPQLRDPNVREVLGSYARATDFTLRQCCKSCFSPPWLLLSQLDDTDLLVEHQNLGHL